MGLLIGDLTPSFFFSPSVVVMVSKTLHQKWRRLKSLGYWYLFFLCVLLNFKVSKLPGLIVEKLPQVKLSKLPNPMQRMQVAEETRRLRRGECLKTQLLAGHAKGENC